MFCKFTQVYENEEHQAVILTKEDKLVLSLLYTRYIKSNKQQEFFKFSHRHYHIQDINDLQHKNVNMY